MMKFFRKYNKQLLAVFMALLMIVFIGGAALEGMMTPISNRLIARTNLGEVRTNDINFARNTTWILDRMPAFDWRYPAGFLPKPLQEVDWVLLVREARQLGFAPNPNAVSSMITRNELDNLGRTLKVKGSQLLEAVAEFNAVQDMAVEVAAAAAPTEAEIQSVVREVLEKVRINAVVLPAKAFINPTEEFTEEEITAHFQQYREREKGQGLNFGYFMQPAIAVQFIEINRDKLAELIGVPNLEHRARSYYDERRDTDSQFRRPPEDLVEDAEGPAPEPYLGWEEAKALAVTAVRRQQANQIAEQIANWMIQHAGNLWLDAERGTDGYRVAPAEAARPEYLDSLIEKLPRRLNYPDALRVVTTNLVTQEQAAETAIIGAAAYRPERGITQRFGQLAFRTKAIVPVVPEDEGANPADYLAPYQICPLPLTNQANGNHYIFRVVDSREGHPAESIDEAGRERVLADLRLARAFKRARDRAEAVRSCVPGVSLIEAYESDLELVSLRDTMEGAESGYFEPPPFARRLQYQITQPRVDTGTYVSGGVGQLPPDVVEKCFALKNTLDKTGVFEVPDRAMVLVAEWVETILPDGNEFFDLREQALMQLRDVRMRVAIESWLDPANIRARNGFVEAIE